MAWGSPNDEVANALDCNIVGGEFKLYLSQTNSQI